jgi:FMN phosphatase YigB (HAD superfamily)
MVEENVIWFDVFGTLIENKCAKQYGKKILSVLQREIDFKSKDLLVNDYWNEPYEYFKNLWVNKNTIDDLVKLFELEKEKYFLKPYTTELIWKLRKYKKTIFLLSNLSSLYVPVVEKMLAPMIKKRYYSCYLWMKKNLQNPKIFEYVANDLWVPTSSILFVWDSYKNDILASQKVWYNSMLIQDFLVRYSDNLVGK